MASLSDFFNILNIFLAAAAALYVKMVYYVEIRKAIFSSSDFEIANMYIESESERFSFLIDNEIIGFMMTVDF